MKCTLCLIIFGLVVGCNYPKQKSSESNSAKLFSSCEVACATARSDIQKGHLKLILNRWEGVVDFSTYDSICKVKIGLEHILRECDENCDCYNRIIDSVIDTRYSQNYLYSLALLSHETEFVKKTGLDPNQLPVIDFTEPYAANYLGCFLLFDTLESGRKHRYAKNDAVKLLVRKYLPNDSCNAKIHFDTLGMAINIYSQCTIRQDVRRKIIRAANQYGPTLWISINGKKHELIMPIPY